MSDRAIAIAAGAGDLIIWRQDLPHGATPSRTDRPRMAQYLTMYPADLTANPGLAIATRREIWDISLSHISRRRVSDGFEIILFNIKFLLQIFELRSRSVRDSRRDSPAMSQCAVAFERTFLTTTPAMISAMPARAAAS